MENKQMKQMTVEEVLEITIAQLNGIMVPIGFADQISRPLAGCVGNLTECLKVMKASHAPKEEDVIDLGEIMEDAEDGSEADAE